MNNNLQSKFNDLNNRLIKHYSCFNTERFYLDELDNDYVVIVSSIEDTCPIKLCKNIAKFTYKEVKKMGLKPNHIYVGAWAINTDIFEKRDFQYYLNKIRE